MRISDAVLQTSNHWTRCSSSSSFPASASASKKWHWFCSIFFCPPLYYVAAISVSSIVSFFFLSKTYNKHAFHANRTLFFFLVFKILSEEYVAKVNWLWLGNLNVIWSFSFKLIRLGDWASDLESHDEFLCLFQLYMLFQCCFFDMIFLYVCHCLLELREIHPTI